MCIFQLSELSLVPRESTLATSDWLGFCHLPINTPKAHPLLLTPFLHVSFHHCFIYSFPQPNPIIYCNILELWLNHHWDLIIVFKISTLMYTYVLSLQISIRIIYVIMSTPLNLSVSRYMSLKPACVILPRCFKASIYALKLYICIQISQDLGT
ncbi:hypothetical protein BDQ12DRAFT_442086 [Crucibulum laeve]|uniref:Uncharacterized protein n=1 Tax=Crucibulum laeve TaxID=68775 RepID=A0A5C3LM51_9AGAR|nr:hypothetical protein BDQ12DRAFT_442086 [Crucibulum laeve]